MMDLYPWESHSVDPVGRYHRAPCGSWLLAFPKRRRFTEPFEILRNSGKYECRFDGFTNWWSVRAIQPDVPDRALETMRDELRLELMPSHWLENIRLVCSRGSGHRRFWTTEDGYRLVMPREGHLIRSLRGFSVEMESEGSFHLEWERQGCEILMRRNAFHARLRAFLAHHEFRLHTTALPITLLLRPDDVRGPIAASHAMKAGAELSLG